jgi:hypothetical protein
LGIREEGTSVGGGGITGKSFDVETAKQRILYEPICHAVECVTFVKNS